MDELAAAAGADPVAFRMKLLTASTTDDSGFKRARSIAVVKAAAERYGWDARPSPKRVGTGEVLTGRGFAYAVRSQTVVAQIVDVEVNRRTGHVWVKRIVCAHDCGLVINPEGLRRTVEGGMLHSLSRALHEEVRFDTEKVTSVDWASYPTLTHADTPESIDVVIVNGDPEPEPRRTCRTTAPAKRSCKPLHRGGGQRHLRRYRRAPAARAVPGRPRAGRAPGREGLTPPAARAGRRAPQSAPPDVIAITVPA